MNMGTGGVSDIINTLVGIACRINCFCPDAWSRYLGVRGLFTNILSVLSLAELGIGSSIGVPSLSI